MTRRVRIVYVDVAGEEPGRLLDRLNDELIAEMEARGVRRRRGERGYRGRLAAACIRAGYEDVLRRIRADGLDAV